MKSEEQAGGRLKRAWSHSKRWAVETWYTLKSWAVGTWSAVLVAASLAVTGMLGSVYSSEIASAFPLCPECWNPSRAGGFSGKALVFWVALLITAALFGIRQKAVDDARRKTQAEIDGKVQDIGGAIDESKQKLKTQIDRLEQAVRDSEARLQASVRTMPPEKFLAKVGHFFWWSYSITHAPPPEAEEEIRATLTQAIRAVLCGYARLAWIFDGEPEESVYAANIMVAIESDGLNDEYANILKGRLTFCDPATSVKDLNVVLDLRLDLSATTAKEDCRAEASPDPDLQPLAFAVPRVPQSEETDLYFALPGAPLAYVTTKPEVYFETQDLYQWCEENGDYTREVLAQVKAYFESDDRPVIGSFLSLVLLGDEAKEESEDKPLAVLNIHKAQPGIMKNDMKGMQLFITATRPLRLLLMHLLTDLLDFERKTGDTDTWRIETTR